MAGYWERCRTSALLGALACLLSACSAAPGLPPTSSLEASQLAAVGEGIVIISGVSTATASVPLCHQGLQFYAFKQNAKPVLFNIGSSFAGVHAPPQLVTLPAGHYTVSQVLCKRSASYAPPLQGGAEVLSFDVAAGEITDIGKLYWITHVDDQVPRLSGQYLYAAAHSPAALDGLLGGNAAARSRVKTAVMRLTNPPQDDMKQWLCKKQQEHLSHSIMALSPAVACEIVAGKV